MGSPLSASWTLELLCSCGMLHAFSAPDLRRAASAVCAAPALMELLVFCPGCGSALFLGSEAVSTGLVPYRLRLWALDEAPLVGRPLRSAFFRAPPTPQWFGTFWDLR